MEISMIKNRFHPTVTLCLLAQFCTLTTLSVFGAAAPKYHHAPPRNPGEEARAIVDHCKKQITDINKQFHEACKPSRATHRDLTEIPSLLRACDELVELFTQIKEYRNFLPFAQMVQKQTDSLASIWKKPDIQRLIIRLRKEVKEEEDRRTRLVAREAEKHMRKVAIPAPAPITRAKPFPAKAPAKEAFVIKVAAKRPPAKTPKPAAKAIEKAPEKATKPAVEFEFYHPALMVTATAGASQIKTKGEDFYTISRDKRGGRFDLFAIYDGHGGKDVALFCEAMIWYDIETKIHELYKKRFDFTENSIKELITGSIKRTNEFTLSEPIPYRSQGSTAVIAVLNKADKKLYVANLGDSRAILVRPGMDPIARQLSKDHTASSNNILEIQRIQKAGGRVIAGRVWGEKGGIVVTRSIGDKWIKTTEPLEQIMSEPEIIVRQLQPYDQFLVLASDGLWEHLNSSGNGNTVIANIVAINKNKTDKEIAEALTSAAQRNGSRDDITAVVIRFNYADAK